MALNTKITKNKELNNLNIIIKLSEYDKYPILIQLFGARFVRNNKDNCYLL